MFRNNVHPFCILLMIFLSLQSVVALAQKPLPNDSLKIKPIEHSPRKATIYSAVLPGLGQVYNKKYWKVPIVYAGFTALAYSLTFSDAKYSLYLNEYSNRLNKDSLNFKSGLDQYSDDNILELKNYYQRNRELSIIGFVIWYTLNIVDATVDGHLYSFDISDNLSMNVSPYFIKDNYFSNTFTSGFHLTLTPKREQNQIRTRIINSFNNHQPSK